MRRSTAASRNRLSDSFRKRSVTSARGFPSSAGASAASVAVEITMRLDFRKFRREFEFGPSLLTPLFDCRSRFLSVQPALLRSSLQLEGTLQMVLNLGQSLSCKSL